VEDVSNNDVADTLTSEKRTLQIVAFVLAGFSAILLVVIAFLLHRGRKGVKYARISSRGDLPDNYEKQGFADPYTPGSRHSVQL